MVLVVYCVCYIIFGLIINTIVTKILKATDFESVVTERLTLLEQSDERHTVNTIEIEPIQSAQRLTVVGDGIIATLFVQS